MTTNSPSYRGRHTPPRPGSGPRAPGQARRSEPRGIARPPAGPVSDLFCLIAGERSWPRRRNRCLAAGIEPSWQPVTVETVLAYLNRERIRATYAAVAAVVGICPAATAAGRWATAARQPRGWSTRCWGCRPVTSPTRSTRSSCGRRRSSEAPWSFRRGCRGVMQAQSGPSVCRSNRASRSTAPPLDVTIRTRICQEKSHEKPRIRSAVRRRPGRLPGRLRDCRGEGGRTVHQGDRPRRQAGD